MPLASLLTLPCILADSSQNGEAMECAPEMEPCDRVTETGAAASKWTWPERDRHSLPDCERPVWSHKIQCQGDLQWLQSGVWHLGQQTHSECVQGQDRHEAGEEWEGRLGINQHTPPEAEGYSRVSSGVPKVKPSKNTSLVLLDWGLDGHHRDSLSPPNVQSGFMKLDAGC